MELNLNIFLALIIIFILAALLCFIPAFKRFFSKLFDSKQFKAIRFIIIFFGIIGVILGFLKWYNEGSPKILTEEVSFQLHLSKPESEKALADESGQFYLYQGVELVLWCTTQMRFLQGWQPILTELDKFKTTRVSSFRQDKGMLVRIKDVKKALSPHKLAPTFHDFYIPPKAEFRLTFENKENRKWGILNIENNKFSFTLEVAGIARSDICYVRVTYKKKGLLNYFFADYDAYDKWYKLWLESLYLIQETNIEIFGKHPG